jgi:hypothetical protein
MGGHLRKVRFRPLGSLPLASTSSTTDIFLSSSSSSSHHHQYNKMETIATITTTTVTATAMIGGPLCKHIRIAIANSLS